MAITKREDVKKLVKIRAFSQKEGKKSADEIGIELAESGYEGSVRLPQKRTFYHKFTAYDSFGMAKSMMILNEDLNSRFGTSLEELGIEMREIKIGQK